MGGYSTTCSYKSLSDFAADGYYIGEMPTKSDAQLLSEYAKFGAEDSFTELVQRHTNLVYSAAFRQIDQSAIASEITQSVFVALAQNAKTLSSRLAPDASVAGWLCRSARNLSLTARRTEFRRQNREKHAMEQIDSTSESALDWSQLKGVLDDAMSELSEDDYDALVLRYYQNQNFQAVGQALGVSDDTAQKRVTRALEKLRGHLSRRKVTATASALTLVISANAVQAAPVGLTGTISTAVLAGKAVVTGAATATKAIAMTSLQKALLTTTVVVLAGVGVHESREASQLRAKVQTLETQQAVLAANIQQLEDERDRARRQLSDLADRIATTKGSSSELMKLRGEVARLRTGAAQVNDPFVQQALKWKSNEARLRQLFSERPEQRVPEMDRLPEDAWLDLARDEDLDSELGIRKAFGSVRRYAKNIFVNEISDALGKYVRENDSRLPNQITDLLPYFEKATDETFLKSYRLLHTGKLSDVPRGSWVIADTPIDPEYDLPWGIGPGSYGPRRGSDEAVRTLIDQLNVPMRDFSSAHGGASATSLEDLLPYLKNAIHTNALEQLDRMGVGLYGK